NTEKAVEYLHLAGRQAVELSAFEEAISRFTRGLELVERLPETTERNERELLLQTARGLALAVTTGWGSPKTGDAYARGWKLCQQVGETRQRFMVLWGLLAIHLNRAEFKATRELGEQLLSLAQTGQDRALLLEANWGLGYTLYCLGEFTASLEHLERGIDLYDSKQHHSLSFLYGGFDPGVVCLCTAALVLLDLGFPDQALARLREAFLLGEELSHPFSLAILLYTACGLHRQRGEWRAAQEQAEALVALADEHGFALYSAVGTTERGLVLAGQGQVEEGIAQMHQGMDAARAVGERLKGPAYLSGLAEVYGKAGKAQEGLSVNARAMSALNKSGERHAEAEIIRVKGELLLLQSKDGEAEGCFRKAIEVARKQRAKWHELVASTSLARLWQKQGKKDEARKLMSEIYGWFTEGFDTAPLKEAKALFEELS
ncbi:MAG: hypothetical protein ACE5HE_15200, partial [Phycisphaerae bacterium]